MASPFTASKIEQILAMDYFEGIWLKFVFKIFVAVINSSLNKIINRLTTLHYYADLRLQI